MDTDLLKSLLIKILEVVTKNLNIWFVVLAIAR